MLSDPDSSIIRKFRVLNEAVPPGDRAYGVPHPVMLFVDPAGVVSRKYAGEKFFHRRTMATILAEGVPTAGTPIGETVGGEYVSVRPLSVQREVYPGNRFALLLEVSPRPGIHIYAPGASPDYRPFALRLHDQPYFVTYPPTYPPTDRRWSPPDDGAEEPVYTSSIRVRSEVALGTWQDLQPIYEAGGVLRIDGTLTVQACSETTCWPPADIPITWAFQLISPDRERPAEQWHRERLLLKRSGSN